MILLGINEPRWSEFVCGCPEALPFHNPDWASLLAECYGYRPFALALADDAGRIISGLPVMDVSRRLTGRRWVSLPFTDYCPPLAKGGASADVASELVREARSRNLAAFELRAPLSALGSVYAHARSVRHTSALSSDVDEVYSRFSKMNLRNIRKAERMGVRVEPGRSMSDVRSFYRLHLLTRRRLGVPVQPRRFFDLLGERVIGNGLGFVLSARVNGLPVAAAVFLSWNGTLVYKYGASDSSFWGYRPNNLLFREAIRWGCEHGCHTLDWGRTDLEDTGLREFKGGWGATEDNLIYSTIADAPPKASSGRVMRAMGAIIRHSPPGVCRATGELLYGYTA